MCPRERVVIGYNIISLHLREQDGFRTEWYEYDTAGCSVAAGGSSAIMSRSAWSTGVRCDRAPLCSGDTASRCCLLEDQLKLRNRLTLITDYNSNITSAKLQSNF